MSEEKITLARTGDKMPQVGFGCWQIPKKGCAEVVHTAIKQGYRLFDGACDYGNEVEVGQGIKAAIDSGLVTRKDIFVTTKLWNTYHAKEHVRPAFDRSLKDLGLDYIDLYLIHFPISLQYVDFAERYPPGWAVDGKEKHEASKASLRETWEAMESLVDSGLVRNIGISNMQSSLVQDLLKYARIKPAVLQVEIHPYLPQDGLVSFAQKHNIAITAYSSFGAVSYQKIGFDVKVTHLLEQPEINAIAKKHQKTPAQILLRWATQRGLCVIPKSENEDRMKSNRDISNFKLDDDDIAKIAKYGEKPIRFNNPGVYLSPEFAIFD
eukprot:TRINITY_DN2046_c0_g1_i1.p1 TRINITY_DN2046_c0_g1~~TRINITY_DN2046_c0_g1_i1.p1  ORF type:complete len:323 (+),score=87.59 TRINITY_DN2046_c0_g1_i1:122-1090(+)